MLLYIKQKEHRVNKYIIILKLDFEFLHYTLNNNCRKIICHKIRSYTVCVIFFSDFITIVKEK